MLLAKNASFKNSIWFVNQWKSFHHIIRVQQIHPTKIQMSKSKMPQPGFIPNFCLKCSLQISAIILFLVEELDCFFTFYLECNSCVCLPFHVRNYPQWKHRQLLVIGTFAISWSLGCLSLITQCSSSMQTLQPFCNCPMLDILCFRPST